MLPNTRNRLARLLWLMLFGAVLFSPRAVWGREQYFTELDRLLSGRADEEVAKTASRLRCRLCHVADPPGQKQNVFGRELERALGRKRDVADRRSIQAALHRAVFLLRNRKPNTKAQVAGSSRTIGGRYVRSALKDKAELAAYEMPLSDVLGVLAENHGIAIEIDRAAFKQAGLSAELPISLVVSEVSLQSLLKFLLAEHHLTFHTKGNGLWIEPEDPKPPQKTVRNPVRRGKAAVIDPNLADTLKKYIGRRIQVVEKDGTRLSDLLLKLYDKDGKLDALSLYSAVSSSGKRYVVLSNVKEILYRNRSLFSRSEDKTPIVVESRRLEQEVLARERRRRRESLQAAYRRQAGLERAAKSLKDETGRFPLNRRYEEELGEAADVVSAIGNLAADQARESRPAPPDPQETNPAHSNPTRTNPGGSIPAASSSPKTETPAEPPTPAMDRKPIIMRYRNANGEPPVLQFGVRIRYDSSDPQDPKLQQGTLDGQGQCELEVPEDVRSIRVYTTPFGGFEGTHTLKPSGPTTITIQTEGL